MPDTPEQHRYTFSMNLQLELQSRFRAALAGMTTDADRFAQMVRPVGDAKFGDYQANCAMSLAKELKQNPRQVAESIISRLQADDLVAKADVAGPGFINLTLRPEWLAEQVRAMAGDERLGVAPVESARLYVIDYSSPNVAKPLHVGHLRSTIIGDALKRILTFLGHRVIADNHLGDWGTQFGMLIYGYKHFLDEAGLKSDPVREMVRLYIKVRQLTKPADKDDDLPGEEREKYTPEQIAEAKAVIAACREETARLQAGDTDNLALWQQFIPWSMATITPIYDRLGVSFDFFHGESFYNPMLADVVDDLLARGHATESQGAVVVFLSPPPEDGSEHKADAVIRKRDGAFTYTTSDLATIRYRAREWNPDVMLYVVGTPQSKHFQTLFAVARRWGYDKVDLEHVAFGSVLGNDRRMLSTRNGGAAELSELLDLAVEKATQQYRAAAASRGDEAPEIPEDEVRMIGEVVGLAAVKYADLSQHRTTDYVFSWDKMLAMDGNTATYMQYAFARCRSIFRRGEVDPAELRANAPKPGLADSFERALAIKLLQFEETIVAAAADYTPHVITNYLWDLAKAYSGFFTNCPVLKAESAELRRERLLLCDLTARTIEKSLGLLGIGVVERM
ncbi:MAG: arginine--tRNA ligase [Gemmataceae bacterium]|nr:arginine--tRNA ligase [Gemmataceae bacterium]